MRIYAVGPEDNLDAGEWYTRSGREARTYYKERKAEGVPCYLVVYLVKRPSADLLVRCLNHAAWAEDRVILADYAGRKRPRPYPMGEED